MKMIKCLCGKLTIKGRCKSCSNRNRKGKYHTNRPKGIIADWKNKMFMDKNPNWKGDEVGLNALHEWIKNHKIKPELCEECQKVQPFDLANISGNYLRDISDFRWICRKCHCKEHHPDGKWGKNKVVKLIKCPNCHREQPEELGTCDFCEELRQEWQREQQEGKTNFYDGL